MVGKDRLEVCDWHVCTVKFKIDNTELLHSTNLNGERIDTCIHIIESVCCIPETSITPETNITLLINYKWVSVSHSVMSDSLQPHGLYSPCNSPGQNTGVGSLSLLQWMFPTQELNQGLLHCSWILYQLNYQGSLINQLYSN